MQKIFTCSQAANLEKASKEKYALPPFLMMENAAAAMAEFILDFSPEKLLILCGKGNNGGDGYALARLLQNKVDITLLAVEAPAAEEAKAQYEMCQRLGLSVIPELDAEIFKKFCLDKAVILDCIYGTGFHGELPEAVKEILDKVNKSSAIKIACDIPSGLYFNADYTITMGCQKLALYSDKAKAVCGKIILADLGIAREKFEKAMSAVSESDDVSETSAYLIDSDDCELPLRKNRAAHKGKFGHTAVLCGDKAGAGILAASAAMNFGSGLTSLIKTQNSNLSQFKLSPSLMLGDSIPKKATCIIAGSGYSDFSESTAELLVDWASKTAEPALVLDAGMLTSPKTPDFLSQLNAFAKAKIIITPHLSELSRLLENCGADCDFSVSALAENPEARIAAGKYLTARFPRTTVIMKSANTFIADGGEIFVVADGAQSLAKGGSGDILAGLCASLLAQGYSASSAAITATEHHALLSQELGRQAYDLTPEKLISLL